jgi:hypothetical protein
MKYFVAALVSLVLVFSLYACNMKEEKDTLSTDLISNPISADSPNQNGKLPQFSFKTTEHDFGKIIDGVKVSYKFRFTNVGNADLIISNVKTTCGCTVSRFPKKPVKPGESEFIELTFDSSRRQGFNHKAASVLANTQPNVATLNIKALVISADQL